MASITEKEFEIDITASQRYVAVVYAVPGVNPMTKFEQIAADLREQNVAPGYILFDLKNNELGEVNRYAAAFFNGSHIWRDTISINFIHQILQQKIDAHYA